MKLTEKHIEELLERFLDGQTKEAEEQLLTDYFKDADAIPKKWQEYKEMFDSFNTDAYDFSKEELDAMLVPADDEKQKIVRLLPWASVACVVAIVGLFVWHPWVKKSISDMPSIAQIKPTGKATKDSANVNVEEKLLVAGERAHASTIAKQNNYTLLAEAKPTMSKHNGKNEALTQLKKNNNLTQPMNETKQTEITATPKEITTSELLETINLLVDVGNENITITSLPDNEGFAVRTVSHGGESNSYVLRRCADASSLELKSQVINF